MYLTDYNHGAEVNWKTSSGTDDINPDSLTDGQANHDNRSGTLADFPPFEECETLSLHGHDDWYLPARDEWTTIYGFLAAINSNASNTLNTSTGYWTSSEISNSNAYVIDMSDGTFDSVGKDDIFGDQSVRCVRRPSGSGTWKNWGE